MNRTHLEGAAEKLTAQRGYTFYTGPEGDMGHTVRNYPAAWLAPFRDRFVYRYFFRYGLY